MTILWAAIWPWYVGLAILLFLGLVSLLKGWFDA